MSDITNNADFYYKLSSKLSHLTKEHRWDPSETVTVEVDGETYVVGPFVQIDQNLVENYYEDIWSFNYDDDDWAVGMSTDNWSSWGHMYDDEGNDFDVYKLGRKIIRPHTAIWGDGVSEEVKRKYGFPGRSRW